MPPSVLVLHQISAAGYHFVHVACRDIRCWEHRSLQSVLLDLHFELLWSLNAPHAHASSRKGAVQPVALPQVPASADYQAARMGGMERQEARLAKRRHDFFLVRWLPFLSLFKCFLLKKCGSVMRLLLGAQVEGVFWHKSSPRGLLFHFDKLKRSKNAGWAIYSRAGGCTLLGARSKARFFANV